MASKFQIPIAFKSDPRGLQQAESALGGFGKKLLGIGALVGGAFAIRGIANFAKEAVLGAERAEQFNKILTQVAETTGVFGADVNAATDRMIKFADAHELVIGVEAELIKETQAVLLSFKAVGASGNEVGGVFDRATKAAFDMAAVLKTDARSSAVQLGKALEDPIKGVNALAKAGTTFTDQQKEQIRVLVESGDKLGAQNIILNEVESQYGGAAEAAALGSEKMVLAFGQIQDALGDALAPAFEEFTKFFIEEVVPPLTTFFEEDFPIMLGKFSAMFSGLSEAVAPVGQAIREAFDIPDNVSLLESLLESIAGLPDNKYFQEFVDAVVLLVPELIELIPPLTEMVIELLPLLLLVIPPLTDLVRGLVGLFGFGEGGLAWAIKQANEEGWGWAQSVENLETAKDGFMKLVNAVIGVWNKLREAINKAIEAAKNFFSIGGGNIPGTSSKNTSLNPAATGGPVSARDTYLVGERGPELFTPGVGGFITPNNRLGGGNSTNITINVNAGMGVNGVALGREIVSAIKRYERSSGPVFASA
jgi:hypothetical protein